MMFFPPRAKDGSQIDVRAMKTPVPGQHPTVAIDKLLSLGDIPILVFPPEGQIDGLELRLLLAAIDGESTIREIAEVAGVEAQHAQAVFAQLKTDGCISVLTAAPREGPESAPSLSAQSSASAPTDSPAPTSDPFQGLKPRTR